MRRLRGKVQIESPFFEGEMAASFARGGGVAGNVRVEWEGARVVTPLEMEVGERESKGGLRRAEGT